MQQYNWDINRADRTGVPEAVLCSSKSVQQIVEIIDLSITESRRILLTRLAKEKFDQIPSLIQQRLDYCSQSATAILDKVEFLDNEHKRVVIVTAGTSDMAVAKEVARTLEFSSIPADIICDVGVAGLWRLLDRIHEINTYPIVIACAGMEGAIFSVLAGLINTPLIAVPISVGYGVSNKGKTALESALASCAPGVLTVNIDNGFGAACAAIKMYNMFDKLRGNQYG
ncbi:nickel pincer cofactor biosynthesis protein LarB [Catenovulum maritimum]|uniref:Circadian phase modifier CpmA n=1 Tax=Catenovulum maritimum TaxID=1513271 RepID=A0A0J8GLQ9_9ALTE|nr:nickel pincer cofactor biosynthesis protein LarB [Catenovulum maritimum]KMT63752.1 circadian phase modifier CpmA [Catenovulum maritimum]